MSLHPVVVPIEDEVASTLEDLLFFLRQRIHLFTRVQQTAVRAIGGIFISIRLIGIHDLVIVVIVHHHFEIFRVIGELFLRKMEVLFLCFFLLGCFSGGLCFARGLLVLLVHGVLHGLGVLKSTSSAEPLRLILSTL